jgi:DNA-binding response OmpR family regulator
VKLLIAHGDAEARFAIREVAAGLSAPGLEPVEAGEGAQTVAMLLAPGAPDVAVVDWDLPGCSGPELCRRVRARRGSRAPYIIVLAGSEHPPAEALEAGADDCVATSAPGHELQARIAAARRFTTPA